MSVDAVPVANAIWTESVAERQANVAGLPNNKYHKLAVKYLKGGFGGVLSFGVKGGKVGSRAFVDNVRIVSNMTKYVSTFISS